MSGDGGAEDGRPKDNLIDEDLQRELDEALDGMSVAEILDSEGAAAAAGRHVRRGTVVSVEGDDVFVDLGGRSEGLLSAGQFRDQPVPKPGDVVEVIVDGYDENDGLMLLSVPGATQEASWETLEEGQLVEGRVTGHNKGGLELVINGIRAFMPISQIELYRVEDVSPYTNLKLRCEVVELNRAEGNLVVSQRAILEREAAEMREQLFASLVEGQTVQGIVKTIMPYGAFVDLGGADGLLHVRDMSYARVENPADVVSEGQQVEVVVLKIDRDERKVSLGLKQAKPDPWVNLDEKYQPNMLISGRVTHLADFGAFVEVDEGVEGLIPISEMTFQRRIKHPGEIVKAGDVVQVRVLNVDAGRRRISLSLKRAGADPWMGASVRWPANSVAEGVVTRLTEFGAFVELASGVEGLVHVSELSEGHVRTPGDVVREGQTVQAKVLDVDEQRRRIALSIKQLVTMPDYTGPAGDQPEPPEPQRKRKRPLKGGLD